MTEATAQIEGDVQDVESPQQTMADQVAQLVALMTAREERYAHEAAKKQQRKIAQAAELEAKTKAAAVEKARSRKEEAEKQKIRDVVKVMLAKEEEKREWRQDIESYDQGLSIWGLPTPVLVGLALGLPLFLALIVVCAQ